jgi:acetyl-CoA C-acetyltransferase
MEVHVSDEARIVGWAHSRFGRHEGIDLEQLIVGVTRDALADAQVEARDVDAVVLGHCGGGMAPELFVSSLPLQADPDLRFKPAVRVENACATGTAAIHAGLDMIASGRARRVLVVGAEKMTGVPGARVTEVLASASYVREESARGLTFPGIFALLARAYAERYDGKPLDEHLAVLARIAAKNHANGVRNPYAQLRRDLGFEFCNTVSEQNPVIAAPLRKTDCSLVSDGAAALLLADADTARAARKAIAFRARTHVNDFLPMSRRDVLAFEGPRRAIEAAYRTAGIAVGDLDFAEVHDCFTVAELLIYEAMGLAARGEGARVIDEGISAFDGALPVNPSGGLKSKGHPIGASGVSMHALAAMQLTGTAGQMQVKDAALGLVFNMGGAAVANYASVLEVARA